MNKLKFIAGSSRTPVTAEDINSFVKKHGIHMLNEAFGRFCETYNGGVPESTFFCPTKDMTAYWEEYGAHEAMEDAISIWLLTGITPHEPNTDVSSESKRVWDIWDVDKNLFLIGSDSGGNFILCSLGEHDQTVYFGDHDLLPKLIPIAVDLNSFYDKLTYVPQQ